MTDVLQSLVDKQDTFEIIRDQIALILANEVANQMNLAVIDAKDPEQWNLKIRTERSNPIEQALNDQDSLTPIVSIWFDNGSFDLSTGNVVDRQKMSGSFNIDCYGFGISSDELGTGHLSGDEQAAFESQRATRLVRNFLMASINTYLQKRGLVWRRWVQSINTFPQSFENQSSLQVVATRIIFNVDFNEFAPQYDGQELELLNVDIIRDDDGFILAEADFDYTI